LPWKTESGNQIDNEQSVSTSQINARALTSNEKNVKIKEILSTNICREGSKETSRSSSKKDVEKMVLSIDIHLEGSKETNRSSSKKDVETKEVVSSDIQLRGSQEASRSPSKSEAETKEVLNRHISERQKGNRILIKKDTPTEEDQSTDTHLEDSKVTSRNSKSQRNCPKLKNYDFF